MCEATSNFACVATWFFWQQVALQSGSSHKELHTYSSKKGQVTRVTVCFCKTNDRFNWTFLHVASLCLFRLTFLFLACHNIALMVWLGFSFLWIIRGPRTYLWFAETCTSKMTCITNCTLADRTASKQYIWNDLRAKKWFGWVTLNVNTPIKTLHRTFKGEKQLIK